MWKMKWSDETCFTIIIFCLQSMGICFIGKRNFHDFIEEYMEPRPGKFIHLETGDLLGIHKGTRLQINDRSMIRWICGVKPHDEIIDLLCARLGIQEVTAALRSKRLRWYGHVVRSSSCIKSVISMEVPCSKDQERHGQIVWRLTWMLAALVA